MSTSLRDSRAGGIGVSIGKVRHVRLGGLSAYVRIQYSLGSSEQLEISGVPGHPVERGLHDGEVGATS